MMRARNSLDRCNYKEESRHFLFFCLAVHQIFCLIDFGSEVRRSTCDKRKYTSLNMLLLGDGYMRLQTEAVKSSVFEKSTVTKLIRHRTNNV